MRRRLDPGAAVAAALALAFVIWTILTFRTGLLTPLDVSSQSPGLDLGTGWGQITAALSFVFYPGVDYVILALLAGWAWRRRLRNLAFALLLAVPLAWISGSALKAQFDRPRPPTMVDLVTADGWAYPSGHMIGITTLVVLGVVTAIVTRRSRLTVRALAVGALALWLLVAYNRWALRAHYLTDIVAGGLWGAFVAYVALLMAGVRVVAPWLGSPTPGRPPGVAVIVNPTKVPDWEVLRKHVDGVARQHGWGRPRWTETSEADTGTKAAQAVAASADLVLVAGGDGTVRAVAQGLAGTGVTLAVLPAGTGNLLARNLGIPLDVADALDAAFDGVPQPLDLVRVRADGGETQVSLVMAGIGIDAIIMSETNPDLKRAVGPAAYVMSALSALSRPPFELTTAVDAAPPVGQVAGLAMIANVGQLQGGIQLVPDARPDDGLIDLLIADASGLAAWAGMAGRVVTGASDIGGLNRTQGRSVVLETAEPMAYQIDGDTLGSCKRLEATVVSGALKVMVPRP